MPKKRKKKTEKKLVSSLDASFFSYAFRLLGRNPTQKLEEVAYPKSGLKTEIPQKSWEKSLGRNRA
jgi:hypothetical protein